MAKISDKIANFYGSKGVITRIMEDDQMLRDKDGKPFDIILSSLTVPSRKNTGQFYEIKLGLVSVKCFEMLDKFVDGNGKPEDEDKIKKVLNIIHRTDKYTNYTLEDLKSLRDSSKEYGAFRVEADTFDKYFNYKLVDQLLVLVGIPEGKENLYDPISNKWTTTKVTIGVSSFRRLHFIAEKRASATGKRNLLNAPALGYSKLKSDGQSIGKSFAA